MAWPSSPAWTIFQDESYSSFRETLSYNFRLFNEATRGGLVLTDGMIAGDFSKEAYFNRLSGLIRDRDITSTAGVSAIDFSMAETAKVKFAKGTPPVNIPPHFWEWIGQSPEAAASWYGAQLAEDALADVLGSAVASLVAALTTVGATVVHDGTAAVPSLSGLVTTRALWGDRNAQLACWLMHSKSMFDIWGAALTNANDLFNFGNVKVIEDGFGTPFIVSDLSQLTYVSTGTKYHILGLQPGAVVVEGPNDFLQNVQTTNGTENIGKTIQSQWTWNMGLKGFAYDYANGGRNPVAATLATGTNWDKKATSVKDVGAIMGNFQ